MSLGLVGRKVGMMRIFKDDGTSVPVTVLDCSGNRVTQIKSADTDGYVAIQVAFGKRRATRVNKAMAGHYAKAGVEAGSELREFRVYRRTRRPEGRLRAQGRHVPARNEGRCLGNDARQGLRGRDQALPLLVQPRLARQLAFAQQRGLDRHGAGPGRVFPGKRMAGHLGNVKRTVQLLEVGAWTPSARSSW